MNLPVVALLTEINDLSKIDINTNYLYPGNIFASLADINSEQLNSLIDPIEPELEIREESLGLEELQGKLASPRPSSCTDSEAPVEFEKVFEVTKVANRTKRLNLFKPCFDANEVKDNNTSASLKSSGYRKDVAYKTAIRILKRFFKNTYKSQNRDINERDHKMLSIEDICTRMQSLLASFIPQELLTQDLVYYTIGITGIKSIPNIPSMLAIQKEVTDFKSCAQAFSMKKFEKTLSSESFITLCCYISQKSNDPRTSVLRDGILRTIS
ncbi:unnamed protein product [Moneuplotes crassus]|uniref:Uncharacterized protein n=1 Tax=Euplotes crassus TaxID=5936 RepID=A0AAD1Y891_EUPCR|nr:unnamed protein product [Moneuplotes crassus]